MSSGPIFRVTLRKKTSQPPRLLALVASDTPTNPVLAYQAIHYPALVSAVDGIHEFDRLPAAHISCARETENRRLLRNVKQTSFFGGGERGLSNLVGNMDLDAVAIVKSTVEGRGRIQRFHEVRAQAHGEVGAFDTKWNRVSEAHAAKKENLVAGGHVQRFSDLGGWMNLAESEDPGPRVRTTQTHLLAEGKELTKVFLEFHAGDEGASSALAVCDAKIAERLKGVAGGHAADAHPRGNLQLRGQRLTGFQGTGANLLKEAVLNLVAERDKALAIERD